MNTDDLIDVLSTNVESVDTRKVVRYVRVALFVGTSTAVGISLAALGLRPELAHASISIFMFAKLAFALAVVGLASAYLTKSVRPGGEFHSSVFLTTLPFLGIIGLAAISLASAPSSHWETMVMGDQWLECLLSIPIIAVVPFATIMWAVRRAAPTDLKRTGALAGLVAGGVSAAAYALHCADDSLPFIAVWYGATVVLCTIVGAMLGPRLLRW
jgi:hypothetical protein